MIADLHIENIAIIERLSVSFARGLTVITGETGSGKSLMLDAIAMAFGARVSPREVVRTGCDRGWVELSIMIGDHPAFDALCALLSDAGVTLEPGETELHLVREFTLNGSRSRINGVPVAKDVLESLRNTLVELHNQHDLLGLFQKSSHRSALDALGGEPMQDCLERVEQAYRTWKQIADRLETMTREEDHWQRELDLAQHQWNELNEAQLDDSDEDSQLQARLDRLAHAEKLLQATGQAVSLIDGSGMDGGDGSHGASLQSLMISLQRVLKDPARLDPALMPVTDHLEAIREEFRDVADQLSRYQQQLDYRPDELAIASDRLDTLNRLKRKYGLNLAELIEKRDQLAEKLDALAGAGQSKTDLEQAEQQARSALNGAAAELTALRKKLATHLTQRMNEELRELALPAARFDIAIEPVACGPDGADDVTFLFSANPGEPVRPLGKVASGGELSRLLLALKVVTAQHGSGGQSLIFDEIDSGMSGTTAKVVAEKLVMLAQTSQVFVITHQPILAAMGDHHYHVSKSWTGKGGTSERARVSLMPLDDREKRLSVLSRLASGIDTHDDSIRNFIHRLVDEAALVKGDSFV